MSTYKRMFGWRTMSVVFALTSSLGCGGAVCPEGTYEFAGRCEPIDASTPDAGLDSATDGAITDASNDDASVVDAPVMDAAADDASIPLDSCTPQTFYRDADGDSYGNPSASMQECTRPQGYVTDNTDCDDGNAMAHPGLTLYRDMDGDNHGNPMMSMMVCQPTLGGYVPSSDDCNDNCTACFPGGTEVCDGASLDENCSMGGNEGCACTNGTTRACPGQSDVGECVAGTQTCSGGAWGACSGSVGAVVEACDGRDNDCNTAIDDGASAVAACAIPGGANVSAMSCSAGQCLVAACAGNYLDCDGQRTTGSGSGNNGCESLRGTNASCTGCGDVCGYQCVSVSAGCNDFVQVAAGGLHTCGVREDGTVWCWGRDQSGQVGNDAVVSGDVVRPVRVQGLSNISHVGAGGDHACALSRSGTVFCWGTNHDGQMGDGVQTNRANRLVPYQLSLTGVTQLAVGRNHNCALVGDQVYCWGMASEGQLGRSRSGTPNPVPTVVPISTSNSSPLSGVASIYAGGNNTCALTATGVLKCWGDNTHGELGLGDFTMRDGAQDVPTFPGRTIRSFSIGGHYDGSTACALMSDATVWCWGVAYGNGRTTNNGTPAQIGGLSSPTAISTSSGVGCAIGGAGDVRCWGLGFHLGDGVGINRVMAATVRFADAGHAAVNGASALAGSHWHSCFIRNGAPYCWGGSGQAGALGDGTVSDDGTASGRHRGYYAVRVVAP